MLQARLLLLSLGHGKQTQGMPVSISIYGNIFYLNDAVHMFISATLEVKESPESPPFKPEHLGELSYTNLHTSIPSGRNPFILGGNQVANIEKLSMFCWKRHLHLASTCNWSSNIQFLMSFLFLFFSSSSSV